MSGCATLKWFCRRVGLVKVAEHSGQLLTDWAAGERWSRWTLGVIGVKQTFFTAQLSLLRIYVIPIMIFDYFSVSTKEALKINPVER